MAIANFRSRSPGGFTTMLREQVGGIEARLDEMARSFERLSKQLANG